MRLHQQIEPLVRQEGSRTDTISKPFLLDVVRIPYTCREIGRAFIDINKLDQFRVEMRVTKRPVGHQRVVEVRRISWHPFEREKFDKFGLKSRIQMRLARTTE
jgi:hypothetical protein